jgi:integrase
MKQIAPVRRGKYRQLLTEDQQIRRWYDNVCRGSKVTADVYIRRLGAICATRNTNPAEMIKKNKEDEGEWLYNFLMDLVTDMEREGKAGSYISSNLKAVKSWLSHNGIEFKRKIKVRGVDDTPTLREKHTLATNQLRELFQGSPPQTRCICALMAHAGLRPVSIGNYEGTDGLCVGDITDMQIGDDGVVTFLNIPAMVTVRRELSKAGHQYFTFLSREACEYVQEYLMQRIRSGEVLDASSPLVAPEKSRRKKFLGASVVGKHVRKRLRACKINARPYDLRHTFATQLMLAESQGLIMRDYRSFFMGHKGDIENRYTTNKHTLPQNVVEDMRASYSRSQKLLQSQGPFSEVESLRDETYKRMLMLTGFSEKEIYEERVLEMSDDEIAQKAREKLFSSVFEESVLQKIVPLEKLEEYLSSGWKCEHVIESKGQAIVCPPSGSSSSPPTTK